MIWQWFLYGGDPLTSYGACPFAVLIYWIVVTIFGLAAVFYGNKTAAEAHIIQNYEYGDGLFVRKEDLWDCRYRWERMQVVTLTILKKYAEHITPSYKRFQARFEIPRPVPEHHVLLAWSPGYIFIFKPKGVNIRATYLGSKEKPHEWFIISRWMLACMCDYVAMV